MPAELARSSFARCKKRSSVIAPLGRDTADPRIREFDERERRFSDVYFYDSIGLHIIHTNTGTEKSPDNVGGFNVTGGPL